MSSYTDTNRLKNHFKCIIGQVKADTRAEFESTNKLVVEILERVCKDIDNEGSADVKPVVHARWIICNRLENNIYIDDNEIFRCSSCFHDVKKKTRYCSNCGAKMDEKENEE